MKMKYVLRNFQVWLRDLKHELILKDQRIICSKCNYCVWVFRYKIPKSRNKLLKLIRFKHCNYVIVENIMKN